MRSGAEALVVAAPLALLFWRSGEVGLAPAFAAMFVFALVVIAAGRLLLRAAHAGELSSSAAWVLGVFATAIFLYALVGLLQVLASTAFAIWTALTLGARLLPIAQVKPESHPRPEYGGLVCLALCGAATVLWCREIADAPQGLARDGVLHAWVDHFIHGGVISSFGDPRAAGRGAMELAGFPAPTYHYASYVLPAVFAAPLDVAGLPLSTSVWLPLGFFTMCTGAYALGAALAGAAGGVAALAAIALLPDASNFWPRNGYFSFHWNVLNTPGQAYGVGLTLLAFALLHRWAGTGNARALAAGACLAAGTALFRVHIFVLALPAFLLSAAMATGFVQRRMLVCGAAAAAAFALFVFGFYAATGSAPALEYFLGIAHGGYNEPTAYTGWYPALVESHGRGVAVPAGVLLTLLACLGPFVLLYPAAAALSRRPWLVLPLVVLVCYVALMVTAPIPPYGNPGELVQRPFVVLYAVLAVCTAAALAGWLSAQAPRAWQAALLAGILVVPLMWAQAPALAAPKFGWGWRFNSVRTADGLVPSAGYLRDHARPGDVLAVHGLTLQYAAADPGTQLGALTGIAAYLARPSIHLTGGEREKVALERHAALLRVAGAESFADAMTRLRALGIEWYVVPEGRAPRWDPERRQAAFASGSVAVYSAADRRQPGR